jgi:hypothetical protein
MARFELATSSLPRRHTARLCHIGVIFAFWMIILYCVLTRDEDYYKSTPTGCLTKL